MNSVYRERFDLTLAHAGVDRCPIDLAGMPQSTIESPQAVARLAEHMGFTGPAPADYDKFDRRVLEAFDIDFRRCGDLVNFQTPYNRRISDTEVVSCYGIQYRFTGLYWDIVEFPLAGAGKDELAAYQLPTPAQTDLTAFDRWADTARRLYEDSPYVVVGEHPVFGVLELACWLCGYDHVMMMLALDEEFIHLLFGKILAFQKAIIAEYYSRLGRYLHATTSGDDFGTQHGPFMSAAMWRKFVKPYMKDRIAYTAGFTDAAYLHHSCGSIFDIVGDLAEIGVKILNPIQPVTGMAPERLKSAWGGRIVFHGGLDTQAVLPSNDMAVIDDSVRNLIATMSPRQTGGYIFAPAHNFQSDVNPAAIARMYTTARDCQS